MENKTKILKFLEKNFLSFSKGEKGAILNVQEKFIINFQYAYQNFEIKTQIWVLFTGVSFFPSEINLQIKIQIEQHQPCSRQI